MEPSEHVLCGWLTAAPDALLAVDAEGRIVFVNERGAELFGWSGADLVGQPVERLVPERFGPDEFAAAPASAVRHVSARRKDGITFPAEVCLSAVRDDEGCPLVLADVRAAIEHDTDPDRPRADGTTEREESHRLESLGQLAGGVAHDFNNLLGVILNYSTLLERRVDDPVAAADLREIRVAAERAAGLTRRLLTFARRDVANPEALELNEVIDGVASMLRRTLGEQVTLELELGAVPLVVADRSQIEQVVLSLAINAREALSDRGTITISTESALRPTETAGSVPALQADAVLKVVDDGHGMPQEVIAHAFEPFFTTKARGEGSGLGLATVHGIVLQSGGEVTIDSAVDEGTTVTVVLHGAEGAVPIEHPVPEPTPGSQERILLVEDETALRMATVRILSEHGYEVLAACDGVEALEMVDRVGGTIRILVSDVAMPRMGGNELARRLTEQNRTMPMIFLTGYDSGNMVPSTGRLLAKPVAEETLLRAIREELGG